MEGLAGGPESIVLILPQEARDLWRGVVLGRHMCDQGLQELVLGRWRRAGRGSGCCTRRRSAALAGPLLRAPWAPQVSAPLPPSWGACPCPWDLSPGPLLCPWIWPSPTTAWIWERPVAKPPIASPDLLDPGLARVHHTAPAYSCFLLPHTRGKSAHWLLPTACTVHKANSLRLDLEWCLANAGTTSPETTFRRRVLARVRARLCLLWKAGSCPVVVLQEGVAALKEKDHQKPPGPHKRPR